MRTIYTLLLIVLTVYGKGQDKAKTKDLDSEISRLNTETALVVYSQAIDDYPIWSPNSDFIACNIEGNWYKIRLTNINLDSAKWRGQTIGILITKDAFSPLSKTEKTQFEKVSKLNPREVITSNKTKIELNMNDMSVSLIVTKKGENPKILWTSGSENCHSLVLSPNEKYVAYLCELNGLLIMKIQ